MKKHHMILIIIGTIFVLLSGLHSNLWFDEAYSVALAKHSCFKDIFTIGLAIGHSSFYYYCLKILNIFLGSFIIVYSLFSCFCVSVLIYYLYSNAILMYGKPTNPRN